MKKFLAIYIGSETSSNASKWNELDEKSRKEKEMAGGVAWMKWATENEKALVDFGDSVEIMECLPIPTF